MGVHRFLLIGVFRIVFVITDQKLPVWQTWAWPALSLLAICLFFAAARVSNVIVRRSAFGFLAILTALGLCRGVLLIPDYLPYAWNQSELDTAVQQYQRGEYSVIEGVVSRYTISADRRRTCLYIDETAACTDMSHGPIGYHGDIRTISVRELSGKHVRVFYHAPIILRIDRLE
jgi:hypothetical protein